MIRILSSETRTGKGGKKEVESVTFIDHGGAAHTLTFHPAGTNVAGESERAPRIVGEHKYEDGSTMQAFSFHTPEEAVEAYESGKVV